MRFKLRAYTPKDFDTLYEIDQLCYEPEIAYSRRELRQYMRFPGALCVVGEVGDKVGGFCLAACEEDLGYIITMDVLKEHRRHGLGSALLKAIEEQLADRQIDPHRDRHIEEVWLETAVDNPAAVAFWRKQGYHEQGIRKNYYPGGRDAYTMSKKVGNPPVR